MKILELCHYSGGGCGVWARAREEAVRLARKGHTVKVFSSNLEKGTNAILPASENLEGVEITRFPAKKLGGESFMYWNYFSTATEFKPDVVFAHNYRQLHTTSALRLKKICGSKVFLVTHAPFVEGNITRSWSAKQAVFLYDSFIGSKILSRFDKILAISKWEIPYLVKIGAPRENIEYVPNGIPEEFFSRRIGKTQNKILFLGRVAPKKKIETLIEAIPFIEDKSIKIEIVGPKEKEYYETLKEKVSSLHLEKRVKFSEAVYSINEKIKKIDSAKIYVLASRVEGMPQSLIEAMARERIVIGSDSIAIRDLIIDGENGYLFEFDNPKDLAENINTALKKKSFVAKHARKSVEDFCWLEVMKKIEMIIAN